jgi:DNA-binding Lrp family transcriptional regulator
MEFQFRGVWLPAEILQALEAGKVNTREVMLLCVVEALVTPERGCFASNGYLAKRLGCSGETVRRQLQRLEKIGLVKRTTRNGWRREIETAWSRLTPHKTVGGAPQDCGGYNKTKRGGDDVFFEVPETDQTHTEQATALATAIRTILPGRRCNLRTWAGEFALLAKEASGERVEAALAWYAKKIGGDYVPQAYSAKAFRQKFPAIEAAMRRDGGRSTVQAGYRASILAKKLGSLHTWPKGSESQLPQAVEVCLQRYGVWLRGLAEVAQGTAARDAAFASFVRDAALPAESYVCRWLEEVCRDVTGWDGWDGNLMRRVWRQDAQEFRTWGLSLSLEYAGNPERWERLQAAISKTKEGTCEREK